MRLAIVLLVLLAGQIYQRYQRAASDDEVSRLRVDLVESNKRAEVEYWTRQCEHDIANALARCSCQAVTP